MRVDEGRGKSARDKNARHRTRVVERGKEEPLLCDPGSPDLSYDYLYLCHYF